MIFKVNIGTLTNTVSGYGNTLAILIEQNNKVNSAITELTDLGWSGTAKEKFLEAHKIRQDKCILLQKEIEYMKYVMEKIEKPAALELKRESENFVNYIERIAQGGALTGADVGTISFNGEPTPINRNVDNCIDDDYKKIRSNMNKIMDIVDNLEFTSFGVGKNIASEVVTSIQNQTISLTDFDNGLNLYYNGVRDIESNICSEFSKISGISDIAGFKSSAVITPSGEVDKNKVEEMLLKNSGNLSDEDKQTLGYLDRVLGDKKYTELINEVIEDEKAEVKRQKEANIKLDLFKLYANGILDISDPIGLVEDQWKEIKNLYRDTGADEYVKSKIGEENYNKIITAAYITDDFLKNPVLYFNKSNEYFENSELGKYLKNNGGFLYDDIKMKMIREEALLADAINMGTGMVSLHDLNKSAQDASKEFFYNNVERVMKINGMDDDETYLKAFQEYEGKMVDSGIKSWDAVKGIGIGIVEDAKTTFDVKKAIDWVANPNMTLEDAQDWSQSAINTAMLVDGIKGGVGVVKGKFAKAGEVGAEAGGLEVELEAPRASDMAKNIETNLENNLKSIEKQDIKIKDIDIKDVDIKDIDIDAANIEESLDTQTEISNKNIEAKDFTKDADQVSKVEENATDINEKNIKTEDTSGNVKNEAVDVDKITKDETETADIKEGTEDIDVKSVENAKTLKETGNSEVDTLVKDGGVEGVGNPGLTEPSLTKGGELTEEEIAMLTSKQNSLGHQAELDTAKLLKKEGYDIKPLEEVEGGNGYGLNDKSNPDYLIEGEPFDCYAPESNNPKTVINEISAKTKKQAERITLNLDNYKGDIGVLKDMILRKTNGDLRRLKELMVIKDGQITRWFGGGE